MDEPAAAGESEIFRIYLDAVGLHSVAAAAVVGLGAGEWYALSRLSLSGRLTSGELSQRTGLTTGATTRLIDRLERSGFVQRVADPSDRRKVVVEPVPAALGEIGEVVAPARRTVAAVLERYSPEQRAIIFDYFAHAAPAFQEATEQIRERRRGQPDANPS